MFQSWFSSLFGHKEGFTPNMENEEPEVKGSENKEPEVQILMESESSGNKEPAKQILMESEASGNKEPEAQTLMESEASGNKEPEAQTLMESEASGNKEPEAQTLMESEASGNKEPEAQTLMESEASGNKEPEVQTSTGVQIYKGLFEHLGARPKQSARPVGTSEQVHEAPKPSGEKNPGKLPTNTYPIQYLTNVKMGTLEKGGVQSTKSSLVFSGYIQEKVELKHVRWVGTQKYLEGPKEIKKCIILSYYNVALDGVSNLFFTADDEYKFNMCLYGLQTIVKSKFSDCAGPQDTITRAMELVTSNQPIYMGWVDMVVENIEIGSSGEVVYKRDTEANKHLEYLMLVDIECVTWYQARYDVHAHQLMFWSEETANSVELIKRNRADNTLVLESKKLSFTVPALAEIIKNLKNLSPKKRNVLSDPTLLMEIVCQIEIADRSTFTYRTHLDQQTEYQPSTDARSPSSWAQSRGYGETDRAEQIKAELSSAMERFVDNEDFQLTWVTIEQDLLDIMGNGTIPQTDYFSGGLDMNSFEHFERSLGDIEDQLKENELAVALSRVQACRELYGMSEVGSIRAIFSSNDNMSLLKQLYFKALCT